MRNLLVGNESFDSTGRMGGIPDDNGSRPSPPSAPPADLFSELAGHGIGFREADDIFRKWYVRYALERHQWNQTKTALALGLHRNTLLRYLQMWGWNPKTRRFL